MKIFFHNHFLREPDNDNGNANGGGAAVSDGASTEQNSDTNDADSTEHHGVSRSDIDLYNSRQRRIGGRTTDGRVREGVLHQALEEALGKGAGSGNEEPKDKIQDDKGDTKGQDQTKGKDADKKADKKADKAADETTGKEKAAGEEDTEEEAILKLDASKLVGKNGAPITADSQAHFEKIRGYVGKYKNQVAELEAKLAATQSTEKVAGSPEYEAVIKERDELRQRIDIEQFEQSEGFKLTYEKPYEDARAAVAKFFPSTGMDEDDFAKLSQAFKEANAAAAAGDELKFYSIVDEIADSSLITGGQSYKNKFAQRMETYYEKLTALTEAKTVKSEERKAFVEKNMMDVRGKNSRGAEAAVEDYTNRLLIDKAELLENVPEEMRNTYVKSIKDNVAIVKRDLAKMTVTGEVTEDLSKIIQRGVSHDALYQENQTLAAGYNDAVRKVKILEGRIEELQKGRAKQTAPTDGNRYPARAPQSTEKTDRRPGEGAIEYNLRKQQEAAA